MSQTVGTNNDAALRNQCGSVVLTQRGHDSTGASLSVYVYNSVSSFPPIHTIKPKSVTVKKKRVFVLSLKCVNLEQGVYVLAPSTANTSLL